MSARWLKLALFSLFISISTIAQASSRVRVLNHGPEAAQARIDLIRNAKSEITAQYFIFFDDQTSTIALALLRDAAKRGVRVRLIIDSMYNGIPQPILRMMALSGVEIREYHKLNIFKPTRIIRRMHDKVLIVDRKVMITGGRNIQNDYYDIPGHYQYLDRDIMLDGEPVTDAATYFDELWDTKSRVKAPSLGLFNDRVMLGNCNKQSERGNQDSVRCQSRKNRALKLYSQEVQKFETQVTGLQTHAWLQARNLSVDGWLANKSEKIDIIRFVHDEADGKDKDAGIGPEILSLIDSAQNTLLIETPYVVPEPRVEDAIRRALARGVAVTILTNSPQSGDNNPALLAYYRYHQKDLLKMGVKLYEFKGPQSVHGKTIVVDQKVAYVGSYNLDRLSHNYNTEVGVIFENPQTALELEAEVYEIIAGSHEIGPDGRPIGMPKGQKYPVYRSEGKLGRTIFRILLPAIHRYI